jgi:hypothetical protein
MHNTEIHHLRFSISQWQHLYSLQQAIQHAQQATGKTLSITGKILNQPLLDNQDTPVNIHFHQVDHTPRYDRNAHNDLVLGQIQRSRQGLLSSLPVDARVFEELRRNLVDYADLDGIHIVVSLGIELAGPGWSMDQPADILQLDYAMRGDA